MNAINHRIGKLTCRQKDLLPFFVCNTGCIGQCIGSSAMQMFLPCSHIFIDKLNCYMYNVTMGHIIKTSRKDVPYDE